MAPGVGRYLAQAGLAGTVISMNAALDANEDVTVMDPTVTLTNGILLDLFRIAKKSTARSRRLVDLLRSLGYIAVACPDEQKKWDSISSRLSQQAEKNTKKAALQKRILQARDDCIEPDCCSGDGSGPNHDLASDAPRGCHEVTRAVQIRSVRSSSS